MAGGFMEAICQSILDAQIVNGDHVLWSENGTSESSNLAGTTITTWIAATAAQPSVRGNSGSYESAAATGACTITHFSIWNSAETTQKTEWETVTTSRTLAADDKLSIANNAIQVTLD